MTELKRARRPRLGSCKPQIVSTVAQRGRLITYIHGRVLFAIRLIEIVTTLYAWV